MLYVRQASEVYRNTRENFIPERQHIAEIFLTISTYHFGRSYDLQDILENDWETTLTVGKLKKNKSLMRIYFYLSYPCFGVHIRLSG